MTRPCQKRRRRKFSLLKKLRLWSKKSLPTEKQWGKYENVVDHVAIDRAMSRAAITYDNSLTKLEQQQNDELEFVRAVTAVMQMRMVMISLNIDLNKAPSLKRLEGLINIMEVMET